MKIGIIGGSGLDDPQILKDAKVIEVNTPFGKPSSPLTLGKIEGVDVVILARHGKKHSIMPSNVPFQANIHALKEQGCTHVLATTACGSLRDEIGRGHLVLPDQFIDRTTKRKQTFYEKDKVCHIPMAEPFCPQLRELLYKTAKDVGLTIHKDKTVITIEGPRFSTKAESHLWRQWKADIINMSTVPEVVLAREAGMCYQAIAMSTDYDCYRDDEEPVSWEAVMKVMNQNVANVKKLLVKTIPLVKDWQCDCHEAIKSAIMS